MKETPTIEKFDGKYYFLSNFHTSRVVAFGLITTTVEHAYQAAKATTAADRNMILKAKTPGEAKRLGQKIEIREDWENLKDLVMITLLQRKFSQDPFRTQLLQTEGFWLIEGNTWGDRYWGAVKTDNFWTGKNRLGEMLMEIRNNLRMTGGL